MTLTPRRLKIILAVFAVTIAAFVWPAVVANLQTRSTKTTYSVKIRLNESIVLPCSCKGRRRSEGLGADWTGRTDVSVSVPNADGIPLNYDYSVTGGRVNKTGPNVVWDLSGKDPGEYYITVKVDDGVGKSGTATKRVDLAEPFCHCPCECPRVEVISHYTEVKPEDIIDFEVRTWGGGFVGAATYNWRLEKGTIVSGQGTQQIKVRAKGVEGEMVTAHAEVGGIDPLCNCQVVTSQSVPIGAETKSRTLPLEVSWLSVDETTVYIDCPRGELPRSGTPTSDDLVVSVHTIANSNSINDKLTYTYSNTGGKILGSGANVKWDLTDLQPGTYSISVMVEDGKSVSEVSKKDVNLMNRPCGGHFPCPAVEFFPIKRVSNSSDLIVAASITDGSSDLTLSWDAVGAQVIAGQGTSLVRLRPTKGLGAGKSNVTLAVQYPPVTSFCPPTFTQPLQAPSPELED